MFLHVADKLLGHLLENLFGEVTTAHRFSEANKLDDVTLCYLIPTTEERTITIELLHGTEISVANSNDNDGAGELGELDDCVNGSGHVHDGAISQDHQDRVLVAGHYGNDELEELVEEWSEHGRAREAYNLQ